METLDVNGLREADITLLKDGSRPFIDRGGLIDKLCKGEMTQKKIAESTGLSTSMISHLRTCFLNLKGKLVKCAWLIK